MNNREQLTTVEKALERLERQIQGSRDPQVKQYKPQAQEMRQHVQGLQVTLSKLQDRYRFED